MTKAQMIDKLLMHIAKSLVLATDKKQIKHLEIAISYVEAIKEE